MNWLAHVFLSEPHVEYRLGNLLADIVRGSQRTGMSDQFLRGAECHKAIDAFTDSHPVVRRSRARIGPEQRRFSAVLIDVFYDYLLANSWDNYASTSLGAFTRAFYADIQSSHIILPESAQEVVERIVRYDLLGSYREVQGVERSLQRLSMRLASRWHRTFALESGVADLIAHQDDFAVDFAEFFPSLQAHVDLFNLGRGPASFP